MPIKTGRYFIVNVRTKNQAYLPNANSAEPVQSSYQQDDSGEQWDVIDRKNGHHTIKNVGHNQFAASGTRAAVGEQVIGWEKDQPWLILRTRVKGQYTISTTDSKHFWGLTDGEQGTPIALANVFTDTRNWWVFKEVGTGKDAEVDPDLNNGRTAYETTAGDLILRAVFFEVAPPPVSAPKPLELDLLVIQEVPNEFVLNATDTANKICNPLITSGQLDASNLRINFIEFESLDQNVSHQRFSGVQTFNQLQDCRGPWIQSPVPVIPSSLTKGIKDFRSSAIKVAVLNLRSIPLRNGGQSLLKLINRIKERKIILVLTLTEPHLPDTLFDTDLFRELARFSSGSILSLPANGGGVYPCIVNYLQNFKADSVKTMFSNVTTIDPKEPLKKREHLLLDAFSNTDGSGDEDEDEDDDHLDS